MSEYKASLDFTAKVITNIFLIFNLALIAVMTWMYRSSDYHNVAFPMIIFINICVTAISYGFSPRGYVIKDKNLIIRRPFKDRIIALGDVAGVRLLESYELTGSIRTFGVGGLFGYFGKFFTPKIGAAIWYVTNRCNPVLVITYEGEKIILSPDDPGIVEEIKAGRSGV
jgi:hypothetical protein